MVFLQVGQGLHRHLEAASSPLAPALLRRESGCGLRLTRKPQGWHVLDGPQDRCGCLGWRGRIGWGVLRRSLARMPHHQAARYVHAPSGVVRHCPLPEPPLFLPMAGCLVLGPPKVRHAEGHPSVGLAPGFERLPDSTRARDEGHAAHTACAAHPHRPAAIGLALRDAPPDSLHAPGQTCLTGQEGFDTLPAGPIPQAYPQRQPTLSAASKTQAHRCEGGATSVARPRLRVGASGRGGVSSNAPSRGIAVGS